MKQPTGSGSWSGPGAAANTSTADRTSLDDFIAGLSGSYLMGIDADLAFVVMCEQIKDADRRIRGMMSDIRQVGAMRDAISKHIDRLREFRNKVKVEATSHSGGDDHVVDYPGGKYSAPFMAEYQDVWNRKTFESDRETGRVIQGELEQRIGSHPNGICVADVDAEIKHWETKAQELDQNREIKLVELNSLISKRANALQLLSNMEKKKHEARATVISNLR